MLYSCPLLCDLDLLDLDVTPSFRASRLLSLQHLTRLTLASLKLTEPMAAPAPNPSSPASSPPSSLPSNSGTSRSGSGGGTSTPVTVPQLVSRPPQPSQPPPQCSLQRMYLWSLDGLSPGARHLPLPHLTHPLKVALLTLDLTPMRAFTVPAAAPGAPSQQQDPAVVGLMEAARHLGAHYGSHPVTAPAATAMPVMGSVTAVTTVVRQSLLPAGQGAAGIHFGAIPKCRVELPPATVTVAAAVPAVTAARVRRAVAAGSGVIPLDAGGSSSRSSSSGIPAAAATPSAASLRGRGTSHWGGNGGPPENGASLSDIVNEREAAVMCGLTQALGALSPLAPHIHRSETRSCTACTAHTARKHMG